MGGVLNTRYLRAAADTAALAVHLQRVMFKLRVGWKFILTLNTSRRDISGTVKVRFDRSMKP